jgi:hypothetical protein
MLEKKVLMRAFVQNLGVFSFFLGISFITFRKVITSPGVITMEGEWNIPPFSIQFKQLFEEDLYVWGGTMGSFGSEHFSSGLYYKLFLYSLSLLGMDGEAISKFVSIFAMVLAGYSMFYLCRQMKVTISSSIIAGVFYMMTPDIFNKFAVGHLGMVLTYALLPLVLAFFACSLEGSHKFKCLLLTCILSAIASMRITNYFVISIMLLLFCFIYSGLAKRNKDYFLKSMRNTFIILFAPFLIQAYWTVPFIVDIFQSKGAQIISAQLGYIPMRFFISEGYEPNEVLRFIGTHLGYFTLVVRDAPIWQLLSFIPVIFAFSILLFSKKDCRIIFFATLTVLGVTLVSATKGILGSLWFLILESIPFLQIFRSVEKWYPLQSLGLAVLLGLSSETFKHYLYKLIKRVVLIRNHNRIATLKPDGKIKIISLLIIFLIFISSISTYAYPFFTGNFGGRMQTYEFGEKYEQLLHWLSTEPDDFRVFTLPAPYPTLYNDAKYSPTPGYDMMSRYIGRDFIYYGKVNSPPFERFLIKTLYENRTEYLAELLNLAAVKYIILDLNKRTTATDHGWALEFPEMEFTNKKIINTIKQQKDLTQLSLIDSIQIFVNKRFQGHTFPISRIGLFAGDLDGLISLSYLDGLKLDDLGLIFVQQLTKNDLITLANLPNVAVIIQDGHFFDIILAAASKKYLFYPIHYVSEFSPDEGWSFTGWIWYKWRYQAQLEHVAFTFVPSTLRIPFYVEQKGVYEVYSKLYFGPEASKIKFYIDDLKIKEIRTKRIADAGFRWAHVGDVNLNYGNHILAIESEKGENAITNVVVVPKEAVEEAKKLVTEIMLNKQIILFSEMGSVQDDIKLKKSLFTAKWDDENAEFWTISFGGSEGKLGAPAITTETVIVKKGDKAFKFTVPSGGNYTYAAMDHTYSPSEDWSGYDFLSLWWYGKNTGERLTIRIEDSLGQAQEWRLIENWFGWKELILPLKEPDVFWHNPANLSDVAKIRIAKYEAGSWFLDEGGVGVTGIMLSEDYGVNTSEGFAFSVKEMPFSYSLYIPKQGFYNLYVRCLSEIPSTVNVEVNNHHKFTIRLNSTSKYEWYKIGELHLYEGHFKIQFKPDKKNIIYLDQLTIIESSFRPQTSKPADFRAQKINPTNYVISARASEPFYVFFSERYNPSWKIYLNNETYIKSYPAYSFGNIFFINKTGTFDMYLKFDKQLLYEFGFYMSFVSFSVLTLLISIPTNFFKKILNLVKGKR